MRKAEGNTIKRANHYEVAFEAYLRTRKIPYIAVDEKRRSLMAAGQSLKSLDFIVSSLKGWSWLVDVKGRRFPSGSAYWKNWSTRDDLNSLGRWEQLLGDRFGGLFVFAYNVVGSRAPLPAERLFEHRGALYGFVAIRAAEYCRHARQISGRWGTVALGGDKFRSLAGPVEDFL